MPRGSLKPERTWEREISGQTDGEEEFPVPFSPPPQLIMCHEEMKIIAVRDDLFTIHSIVAIGSMCTFI
jgi:hypothetical protein